MNAPILDTRPLLKWPGGKRRLLRDILPFVPSTFHRYIEPFVGGGAVFFRLSPVRASLSDSNQELVNCYVQVRDNPDRVTRWLRRQPNTEAHYYKVREMECRDPIAAAGQIIYLCTLSFNGIYRTNLNGTFNVPYGRKTHISPASDVPISSASEALKAATVRCEDFEKAMRRARPGDFVYCDPPYTVAHENNGFVKYNSKIFSWADQERLADIASTLGRIGVQVLVSNADHPSIRKLYRRMKVVQIHRPSVIAASSQYRKSVSECLFIAGG